MIETFQNDASAISHPTTNKDGWEEMLFYLYKTSLLQKPTQMEDQRSADWKYYLKHDKSNDLLIIGGGWGTIPLTLADHYQSVELLECDKEKFLFLNTRIKQQKKENLKTFYTPDRKIPDFKKQFDLIYLNISEDSFYQSRSIKEILVGLKPHLKKNGFLYIGIPNRFWSPRNRSLEMLSGYKKKMKEEGFDNLEFYAPLPSHLGVPLFQIPLGAPGAIAFFFRKIFPLFDMVSPEVKSRYGWKYGLAKFGVRIALTFRLSRFTKYFFPSFSILARKAN